MKIQRQKCNQIQYKYIDRYTNINIQIDVILNKNDYLLKIHKDPETKMHPSIHESLEDSFDRLENITNIMMVQLNMINIQKLIQSFWSHKIAQKIIQK